MKKKRIQTRLLTDFERVFGASVVNGAAYHGDLLPHNGWSFPRQTWFQRRLEQVRKQENGKCAE